MDGMFLTSFSLRRRKLLRDEYKNALLMLLNIFIQILLLKVKVKPMKATRKLQDLSLSSIKVKTKRLGVKNQ